MKEFTGIYLQRYEGESISTHDLFIYMRYFFTLKNKELAFRKIDWDAWINGTGYSHVHLEFKSPSLDSLFSLVALYQQQSPEFDPLFQTLIQDHSVLSTKLQTIFFNELKDGPANPDRAKFMDEKFNISQAVNNLEVLVPWFLYCLHSRYTDVLELVDQRVLTQIGRLKFIRPLYNSINQVNHQQAVDLFLKNRRLYHPIAVTQISKDLGLSGPATA